MKKNIWICAFATICAGAILTGCGKEKASTSASGVNATQKIASGENLTIPVKEISEKISSVG